MSLNAAQALNQQIADVKIAIVNSFLANPSSANIDSLKLLNAALSACMTTTNQITMATSVS